MYPEVVPKLLLIIFKSYFRATGTQCVERTIAVLLGWCPVSSYQGHLDQCQLDVLPMPLKPAKMGVTANCQCLELRAPISAVWHHLCLLMEFMKPIVLAPFVPSVLPHPFPKHFNDRGLFLLSPCLWDRDQDPLRMLKPEMCSEEPAHQMSIFWSLNQRHLL